MGRTDFAGSAAKSRRSPRVTARAILIGFALVPFNTLALVRLLYAQGWTLGNDVLFTNAVCVLFIGTLLNEWLKRRRPRWAFGPGELLTIYVLLGVNTALVGSNWDVGGALAGTISYPYWFATQHNGWQDLVWPILPLWLTVPETDVTGGFFTGSANPYRLEVLEAWAGPALWWAALIGVLMWICLCLNSIVRRRWADEEKLPFPITTLPVQLVDERFKLLRSRLFWLGVLVSAGLGLWNTLPRFYPGLPAIPLFFDYREWVLNRHPWDFIRYRGLSWSPWALGLCYLMPLDLAFSLLAFDLLWTASYVLSGHLALSTSPWSGFPYGEQQSMGAYIALLLSVLWLDRRYLAQVIRKAIGLRSVLEEDREEALGYRAAVFGVLAGVGVLWWILARGGMQHWVVVSLLGLYGLMALFLSRLRAQLGPPTHELLNEGPDAILYTVAGSRSMAPKTLGMMALLRPYLLSQRGNPVPVQLEGLKMAEGGRMERSRLGLAMAVVVPLTILCYFWAQLHIGYNIGLGTGNTHPWNLAAPREFTSQLADSLRSPTSPDASGGAAMGVGFILTVILMRLKLQFLWWPLHPVAYPISLCWSIDALKPALFITLVVKGLLLRYGGLQAHRTALPLFLGMLAGSATYSWMSSVAFMLLGMPL